MKKLLFILLIISQTLNAQDLDSLKFDYIKCNKEGKFLNYVEVRLLYARPYELAKPYDIYLQTSKDGVFSYKILIDPDVADKKRLLKEVFSIVLDNELLEFEVKI